ncbi:MAG: AAA family ATPase, partial [Myxococcales bacterium]|nr:AAA family ATPase [Myxococcales bacterium]
HILLEDVPGVGKTTLAQSIARALGCSFRRIQFTSDLLPSDILGVNVYSQREERFEFRPGPVFANLVLADEINRTTPKTQSSLLEAMNEGQVSLDDQTRPLPRPFIVIATQNPQDYHGTYPLPESQLDRFMVRLRLGYPADDVERAILRGEGGHALFDDLSAQTTAEELLALQAQVDAVKVEPLVLDYLLSLVHATRNAPHIELGISTRGALAFQRAAKARALLDGRGFVRPDDLKALAIPVLAHRVHVTGAGDGLFRPQAEAEQAIQRVLASVPVPL